MLSSPLIIDSPTGRSSLPYLELDRDDVKQARKQIRVRRGSTKRASLDSSFGDFTETLRFKAWKFFHAAKKTEYTTSFSQKQTLQESTALSFEYRNFFVWDTSNLRRVDTSVFGQEDFSSSHSAGRFGEAVTYLLMLEFGYVYWDRISVLADRALRNSDIKHAERLKRARAIKKRLAAKDDELEPDFAFENRNREVALVESKGSVVDPERDDPSTKDDLRHGLNQIEAWANLIRPTPQKSFVVGSYFRQQSDDNGDPSLIAFVDPPGKADPKVEPIEFPPDWIRRGNYGAWLRAMGYPESARGLENARKGTGRREAFPVVRIGEYDFAFATVGLVAHDEFSRMSYRPLSDALVDILPYNFHPLRDFIKYLFSRGERVHSPLIIGLEVNVLTTISKALLQSYEPILLEANAIEPDQEAEWFSGSTLPDGSMVGTCRPDATWPQMDSVEFIL